MAEDGPLTPEKQLLKLIEENKSAKDEPAKQHAPKPLAAGPKAALFSFSGLRGAFLGRLSFFRRTSRKKIGKSGFPVDIVAVNRILTAAAICLFGYVVFDMIASAMSLHHPPTFLYQKEKAASAPSVSVSPLKESAYYQQKVTSRDIFKEGAKPASQAKEKKEEAPPVQDNEAVRSLSIVGISWSSSPDVIIEDKAKQKTYFVKRGQMVGDNIKVEAVFKDHVVLSLDGQEFELR